MENLPHKRRLPDEITAAATLGLFVFLIIVNVTRTLRHPMWRDELETYWIAVNSASFSDLLANMKYTSHPAMLYALEWLVTRLTSDPTWIQIMQIVLALGVWFIIYLWAPFSRLEKILLLLGYFLFWEYFVISRNYVLIALIAFAFTVLRERQPRREFLLWILLGLLANVHMYSAIWSVVLAVMLATEEMRSLSVPKYVPIAGGCVYVLLLAFAIEMMQSFPLYDPSSSFVHFRSEQIVADLYTPLGAFVPFNTEVVRDAVAYVTHPDGAKVPDFFNALPAYEFLAVLQTDADHPLRMALVFAAPIAICWLITRNALLVLEFAWYISAFCCSRISGTFRAGRAITAWSFWLSSPWCGRHGRAGRGRFGRIGCLARFFWSTPAAECCRSPRNFGHFRKATRPRSGSGGMVWPTPSSSARTMRKCRASSAICGDQSITSNASAFVHSAFGTRPGAAGSRPRSSPAASPRPLPWQGNGTRSSSVTAP